jgi:hypothetical protein
MADQAWLLVPKHSTRTHQQVRRLRGVRVSDKYLHQLEPSSGVWSPGLSSFR